MVVTNYIAEEAVEDNGVHFFDPDTWELLAYVQVPWTGADDADLTADGRYLAISAEYSGYLVFIDTEEMTLADRSRSAACRATCGSRRTEASST